MQTVICNVFSGICINPEVLERKLNEVKRGFWCPWFCTFLKEMIYLPDYYYTVEKMIFSNRDYITVFTN